MEESVWARAAFQEEITVMRLRLRPYSCGHEILLSHIGSPVLSGGNVEWSDVFTACLICAHDFRGGIDIIRRPRKAFMSCLVWRFLTRGVHLIEELHRFRNYIHSGTWQPKVNPAIGDGCRRLKAPRAWRLVPFLCTTLGLNESDALNFPMARANAYYAAVADKTGEIDLCSGETLLEFVDGLDDRERRGENLWDF